MSKLPALTPKKVSQALERAGFIFKRQRGSHKIYAKDNLMVTVPFHNKDLKVKTLRHIIKQANLEIERFLKFL